MMRLVRMLAVAAFLAPAAVIAAKAKKHDKAKPVQPGAGQISNADLPPLVLIGTGRLDCTISSKANGSQILNLTGGAGVNFDVEVTPILDGILELKNGRLTSGETAPQMKGGRETRGESGVLQSKTPDRTMNYRFTSNLARAKNFRVTGFALAELMQMETRVSVNARRYRQDKGPGTEVSFSSDDMDKQGVYIEFRGIFREKDTKKRFAFRTIMGPPSDGQGQVTPLDSNDTSRIVAKSVVVDVAPRPGGPYSQITTTIRELDGN